MSILIMVNRWKHFPLKRIKLLKILSVNSIQYLRNINNTNSSQTLPKTEEEATFPNLFCEVNSQTERQESSRLMSLMNANAKILNEVCARMLTQSCLILCDPMDCSPPGSSVHGLPWARTLEWAAMPSSKPTHCIWRQSGNLINIW